MSASPPGLAEVFVTLSDSLREGSDIVDTMDVLVEACTAYTSAVEAGIVLADRDGGLHVVASTSERSTQIEEEQLGTDAGPCWIAFQGGEPFEVADVAASADRWPRFAAAAAARGFKAAHAVPLRLRDTVLGSLNLFSDEAIPLSDADAALAQALADVATIGILQQQTLKQSRDLNAQLQYALDSRVVIEQAKGMLAERNGTSVTEAFHTLRTYARGNGLRLHDVARDITSKELSL